MTVTAKTRRRGFTLIELLVVIGIIVLLAGILIPVVTNSIKKGRATAMAATLQSLTAGLNAYKDDFGDYPRVNDVPDLAPLNPSDARVLDGARTLCRALIAPGAAGAATAPPPPLLNGEDGFDGPGFRVRRIVSSTNALQGKSYGPYVQVDKFKVQDLENPATPSPARMVITDGYDKPILYMPAARVKPNISAYIMPGSVPPFCSADDRSLWDLDDVQWTGTTAPYTSHFRQGTETDNVNADIRLKTMLGDANLTTPTAMTNQDGLIQADETPVKDIPFALWSAGDDGLFGPIMSGAKPTKDEVTRCDDVTNFNK
jgi:prepilin-type N-terminal cleavage/methylation domain-containing protein